MMELEELEIEAVVVLDDNVNVYRGWVYLVSARD